MEDLTAHLTSDHLKSILAEKDAAKKWEDVLYLFPTYDNDPLLGWDDGEDDDNEEDNNTIPVIAEKIATLNINDRLKQ
jgi:hypothetical protein